MVHFRALLLLIGGIACNQVFAAELSTPTASKDLVFAERDGVLAVEAEHFFEQSLTSKRVWHLTSKGQQPDVTPDGDPTHVAGASGGAYLEILPDTRRTHGDKLKAGENFSNEPGQIGVLKYRVKIATPGRYYVWVRAYSTTTEDNGLHVGIDGEWPASGQRLQWCAGKNSWHWESKQRTAKEHCGVPHAIFLDIEEAGEHVVAFSMREDGFEFDKWLMTLDRDMPLPNGLGPKTQIAAGKAPPSFAFVQPAKRAANSPTPAVAKPPLVLPREKDGDGSVAISGEKMQWHKVTLTLNGPFAHEQDQSPNPFTDCRMTVRFQHESGSPDYTVPAYFAADGDAGESSASSGTKWRAHLSPDKPGCWNYAVSFERGTNAALLPDSDAKKLAPFDGLKGSFAITPTNKSGRDLRGKGRLEYVGKRYLQFAGTGEYFLKAGPDAPETLLGYEDFDGTSTNKVKLKTWQPHVRDWRDGDPVWKDGRGKGLIGALNYLAEQGCNVVSFLPYNGGGDGDNVWPFVARNDKLHYDCSKLDQWQIVFDHTQTRGLYLHFKLQETENDDNRRGHKTEDGDVPAALDGGDLGIERRLYCRELVARFGHELALNWNLGEENSQSPAQQRAMAQYLRDVDPYDHHIVIHTFPDQQDKVYPKLLGDQSVLTGASLQNSWKAAHQRTLKWIRESKKAGRPWVIANDEQNPASMGVPPDEGFEGSDGYATEKDGAKYNRHDVRRYTLWGTLLAGGAGVEYYFGYRLPQNDLICEDFRSREQSWRSCRIALDFFRRHGFPISEMSNADELVGNPENTNSRYCFAKRGELYLVFLPKGGSTKLDLRNASGRFSIRWFDPRNGGKLQNGSVTSAHGGSHVSLGTSPDAATQDWLIVVRRITD
ncbi:MAG: DUF5060 domain-containing protein [Planctomycetota bacterium]